MRTFYIQNSKCVLGAGGGERRGCHQSTPAGESVASWLGRQRAQSAAVADARLTAPRGGPSQARRASFSHDFSFRRSLSCGDTVSCHPGLLGGVPSLATSWASPARPPPPADWPAALPIRRAEAGAAGGHWPDQTGQTCPGGWLRWLVAGAAGSEPARSRLLAPAGPARSPVRGSSSPGLRGGGTMSGQEERAKEILRGFKLYPVWRIEGGRRGGKYGSGRATDGCKGMVVCCAVLCLEIR